jgi:hypothetical protein
MSKKPDSRKTVRDTDVQPVGMFAVFRHSKKLSRAHFCALHNDYTSASHEAVRLMADQVKDQPEWQHIYYVVEIAAMFQAGPEGLKSEER